MIIKLRRAMIEFARFTSILTYIQLIQNTVNYYYFVIITYFCRLLQAVEQQPTGAFA